MEQRILPDLLQGLLLALGIGAVESATETDHQGFEADAAAIEEDWHAVIAPAERN
jgi:hypothetical protein